MNKAFIFDMDGVLIDSESISVRDDYAFSVEIFGKEIADKLGDPMGFGVVEVHKRAVALGATIDKELYIQKRDERARLIYDRADITEGSDRLVTYLADNGYKLGVVSATQRKWIDYVLTKLHFREKFEVVISVNDEGLPSKPAPDGYREALRRLDAEPKRSIVLEDSNRGIASGKAAGCYVIGYRGHLIEGYEQTGADAYADTMDDVIKLVESFDRN